MTQEEPEQDDAVIGQAFRWSLIAFSGIAIIIVLAVALTSDKGEAPPAQDVDAPAPVAGRDEAQAPEVRFTDVTVAAGIDFVHENGATGMKLLPETMGGGVGFLDYDGDGDADIVLIDSCPWPADAPENDHGPSVRLYENDGNGNFRDATSEAGFAESFYGMGLAIGDYDCDGDPDLYVTALGPNRLYRNEGGSFREIEAGVAGSAEDWGSCASFFDADGDGDLDLYVGNYVRWSREIDLEVDYRLTGIGRAYGPPANFEGSHAYLLRNDGGTFTDISAEAGIHVVNPATNVPIGKALGVLACDFDEDGDLDLAVANDTVQNFLFVNDGNGRFEEQGTILGIAYDQSGRATGAMGIDGARFRDDGALGFAIGNFANEMSALYVAQGSIFTDEAIVEGIGPPTRLRLTFGVLFLDYDLDGRLDLLHANGHLEDDINKVQASQSFEQPPQLFWNAGADSTRTFVEVDGATAGDLQAPIVGRGAAYADVDGDGDLDLLLTQTGRRPVLLRNDQATGHHWLRVRLQGRDCSREAIGAVVELTVDGRTQRRELVPSRSYLSHVELPMTFGLGTSPTAERLRVTWPDGSRSELEQVPADQTLVVDQP